MMGTVCAKKPTTDVREVTVVIPCVSESRAGCHIAEDRSDLELRRGDLRATRWAGVDLDQVDEAWSSEALQNHELPV